MGIGHGDVALEDGDYGWQAAVEVHYFLDYALTCRSDIFSEAKNQLTNSISNHIFAGFLVPVTMNV